VKKIIIILLILCSIHFWGLIYIPIDFYNITNTISLLILGISFLKIMRKKGLRFKNAIILFFVGLVLNIISAYVNQGQHPWQTFLGFGSFYFILFYFFLHTIQISRKFIESIILIFAILYSVLYIIQVSVYPNLIFRDIPLEDRGTLRLLIEGNGFLMLAYFLMLNRYLLNFRFINILFALFFFVILFMGGFRTLTFGALFISIMMFYRLTRLSAQSISLMVFLILLFVGIFQLKLTSDILGYMVNSTEEHLEQGNSYIRILEFDYFLNKYPENGSIYVFGGGLPVGNGSYSRTMEFTKQQYGYFWDDLGIIGFYIVIGVVALLGLLWYAIKAIFIKIPPGRFYLNFYFLYLLIVSFTTMEIYRTGIFAVEAIVLYLIDEALITSDIAS
jgi:hypothetical protein